MSSQLDFFHKGRSLPLPLLAAGREFPFVYPIVCVDLCHGTDNTHVFFVVVVIVPLSLIRKSQLIVGARFGRVALAGDEQSI